MKNLTLGQRILEIRGKTSRKDFAKDMECGTTTLQRYENDERLPDIEFLMKLQTKTGLSLDYLVHGKEMSLKDDEALVIEKYRDSDDSTKNKVLLTLMGSEKDSPKDIDKPKTAINIEHNENSPLITGGKNTVNYSNQSGFTELEFLLTSLVFSLLAWGLGIMANIKATTDVLMSMAFGMPGVVLWAMGIGMGIFAHCRMKQKVND